MKPFLIKVILFQIATSFILSQCDYELGDTNNDDIINVIDIISIVNFIIENNNEYSSSIDLNFDFTINVDDIIILVNRINEGYPMPINIEDINFDFNELSITWPQSDDYGFVSYSIYYNTLLNQDDNMIYYSTDIGDTSLSLFNIQLNEQNWFSLEVTDFMGCELFSDQYYYELP